MTYFLWLLTEDDFLSLFGRSWIEIHVLLESPVINFSQDIIQFICRCIYAMCNSEQIVSTANSLALEERPVARLLI